LAAVLAAAFASICSWIGTCCTEASDRRGRRRQRWRHGAAVLGRWSHASRMAGSNSALVQLFH
jgi:hypothetical protein